MKSLVVIFLVLLSSFNGGQDLHDFHLSKTDINFKPEDSALQITVTSFIDDMEDALVARDSLDYKLLQHAEHALADSVMAAYFREQLVIKVDGEQVDFYYLGKEQSEDIQAVYSYLEVEGVTEVRTLDVENKILTEMFDDQKNIINVKVNNKSKATHILTKNNLTKQIKL